MNKTFEIVRKITLVVWIIDAIIVAIGLVQLFALKIFEISSSKMEMEVISSYWYLLYGIFIILIFLLLIYGLLKLKRWFLLIYWISLLIYLAPLFMLIYIFDNVLSGLFENLLVGIFGFIIPIGLGMFYTINYSKFKKENFARIS
ncbi:MAG: hypothetical protein D8M58_12380 [Calditrichaeota bacterium]|nr:MAG: hypothetical protein DWQ03_13165 [Calditrichota bacterium]MBL1206194.1 hypothetical protein [Calditrichota bacterium]NOG46018.1 hypothetical protein [Calditrichota bacterium]